MVAVAVGIRHPSHALALTLPNTAAKNGTEESWQARIAVIERTGIAAIAETILDRWFAKSFRASIDALAWATILLCADPKGYIQTCRALARVDLREGLGRFALPVLLIAGSEDQSALAARVVETDARIPGARLIQLAGSGHIPAMTHRRPLPAPSRLS